jgi:hypothetical protein
MFFEYCNVPNTQSLPILVRGMIHVYIYSSMIHTIDPCTIAIPNIVAPLVVP